MEFEFQNDSEKVVVSKEDVEIIIRNAGRLGRLSSDILELARIERQRIKSAQIPLQHPRDNIQGFDRCQGSDTS